MVVATETCWVMGVVVGRGPAAQPRPGEMSRVRGMALGVLAAGLRVGPKGSDGRLSLGAWALPVKHGEGVGLDADDVPGVLAEEGGGDLVAVGGFEGEVIHDL